MSKISAAIITYNEGAHIERCLKSLQGVADEVVVVDSFSTDNTIDVCLRYNCVFTQRKFNGFGAQKQYALSLTTNSYVLSIDADEWLDDDLRRSIISMKKSGFKHRVYSLSRLNYYCGVPIKHCGWAPDSPIRLFDKRYASWNLRDVHEAIIFPGTLRPKLVFGLLIHHRCRTPQEYRHKEERYATINSRILINEGKRAGVLKPYVMAMLAFLRVYVRHRGFLDGHAGFEISNVAAHSAFATYRLVKRRGGKVE